MSQRKFDIVAETSNGRKSIGTIYIDYELVEDGPDVLDLAITPVVHISPSKPDYKPFISEFLISKRTTLRTSPREPEYPHRYLDDKEDEDDQGARLGPRAQS